MAFKIATQKAYGGRDGTTLFPHGDAGGAYLFAVEGKRIPQADLARFTNADEFFASEGDHQPPAPPTPTPSPDDETAERVVLSKIKHIDPEQDQPKKKK